MSLETLSRYQGRGVELAGVSVILLVGKDIPLPAPELITRAVDSIQVTNTDEGRDGFEIIFSIGRSATDPMQNAIDFSLIDSLLLETFNRVIIMVEFGFVPIVLIDGIITHKELNPSTESGQSKLTVKGEDVSIMMDREEQSTTHPNQPDPAVIAKIIGSYAKYGLVPVVIPPPSMDVPLEVNRVPSQQKTDLQHIKDLAGIYDYIFYIEPTSVPLVNKAYWGPKEYFSLPQKALTLNMGSFTNVTSINFQYNSLDSTIVQGKVQDPLLNREIPVVTVGSLRPPLALFPDLLKNIDNAKKKKYRAKGGVNAIQAYGEAQARTDSSTDAVTATGELDGLSYGDVLRARKLVGLRGVGFLHDGFYYVKNVTHKISKGEYKQSFTISREGLGSTTPVVLP
jgi:hypothetical protein